MNRKLLYITALASLIFAAAAFAKPYDPERSAPKSDVKPPKEFAQKERMHMRQMMEHRHMAREHKQQAMKHREMARMHRRELNRENCPQGFDCPNGPQMKREHMRQFRGPSFDNPMGPGPMMKRHMQFRNEQFGGPQMNPDRPMAPPPHMRFRDGKRGPRAL